MNGSIRGDVPDDYDEFIEYPHELSQLFENNSINNNIEKTNNEYLIVKKDKVSNLKKELEKLCIYCDIK